MVKKPDSLLEVLKCVLLTLLVIGMAAGTAGAFYFKGHTSDETGETNLSGTNASIWVLQLNPGTNPTRVAEYFNLSDNEGKFNITGIVEEGPNYFYKINLRHFNSSTGRLDYIGQSLPELPYSDMMRIATMGPGGRTRFFLRPGGTINITAVNETGESVKFNWMVKDTKLGYPIEENLNKTDAKREVEIFVPLERNYSIMIYPQRSFPVSYYLNNLSIQPDNYSNIIFNTSNTLRRVSGYANLSGGSSNFSDLKIIAYLMEPGNMVFKDSKIPFNMGTYCIPSGLPVCYSDVYNATNGSYNIALPGAQMAANILLFATAKNSSNNNYYGSFRNITLGYSSDPVLNFNFTLKDLIGSQKNITVLNVSQFGQPSDINVTTKQLSFKLQNNSNTSDTPNFAHVEIEVNYSAHSNVSTFSWMVQVRQTDLGVFSIPAISADIKKIKVFTQGFAPLKTSKTAAQLTQPVTINLTPFNPGRINDSGAPPEIFIDILKGRDECDVPYPPAGCSFIQRDNKSGFNPFKAVIGGGKISFRMIVNNTNITVHYKNVDLLASGPPDALFDNNATDSQSGSALEQAWRFGSMGPEIYDGVIVGVPLADDVKTDAVTVRLGKLYDNEWNVTWDIDANTTDQLPSDYSDFNLSWFSPAGMPCSNSDPTADCYVNASDRMVWLTIPHFSGFGAEVSSNMVGNVTATLSPNSSIAGSTVNVNFTVIDTQNSTSWFNITFLGGFDASGALVDLNINGSSNPVNWINITGTSYVNVSSNDAANVSANNSTTQYINLSNIIVPSSVGSYIINVSTGNATVSLTYNVNDYGVNLTNLSALALSRPAGTNATYTLNLTNNGTVADTYNLTVTNASSASTAALNLSSVALNPNESRIFTLNVTNTSSGIFYVNVTAISQGNQSKVSSINTTTNVTAVRGVSLTNISALANTTNAGTNATYLLNLTNTGSDADTYDLTVTNVSSASTAVLNVSLPVALNAGASSIFALNVTNTSRGTFYVNVTATSQNDSSKVNYINTTTTVAERGVNLTNLSIPLALSTPAGTNATYILNLTNTGTDNDTFDLTVTNASSASTAVLNISSPVTLNAGASSIFKLNVTNTSSGIFYVNVTAISQGNQSKVSSINTTTNVTAVRGVSLTNISALANTTNANTNATYILNLTNTGSDADTYDLTVTNASSASTAALNITSPVALNAGASSIFTLNVTNTSIGTFYVNVTATSQIDSSKVSYINTTTIVASRGVNLTNISVLSNSTRPATNATYYFRLTNNGSASDTYSLTINNINSATNASLNVSSVGLSSLASTIFTLNVTNLTGGEFNVTVIATSQGDATKVGYINTTTYVQSSPPITPTNYWGTVRVAGTLNASAAVKVYGANGIEVASNTSIADGNYSVYVPWDDSTTPADEGVLANEKITFRVNGLLASLGGTSVTERTVDGQGTSTRLDLNVTDNQPPVITIFYPANNSNISIFDRVINGSITDNSNINASMGINGALNNTWTAKGNFSLIANYTAGDNTINVSANDTYGNYNATVIIVHVLPPSNVTNQNITNNTSFNITANATTGVDLVLTTGNNSANVTVTINASTNASDFNATNISNGLGRYVDINATGDTANLTSVKLTMFYYHSDLDKNGNGIITDVGDIDETSLKLYWYWDNATLGNKWLPITTDTNYSTHLDNNGSAGPVVIGSAEGNTTANYLSVTMNHFSIYTINGTVIPTPPGGCTSNCGTTSGGGSSGGGGGGGGGASAENFSNILIKERVDMYIFKDKVAAYFFKLTDPIVYVNITGNTNAGEVTTTVEVLKNTSTLVNNISAPGTVYKNVNIWAGTSGFNSPRNIKEGLIVFKILNSWMSDNKVKGKDVVMVKWDGSNWISLETKEVSKDDTHTYFEAKTNLFSSPFAITTTSGKTPEVTEPKPEVTPKETPKATATPRKGIPAVPAGLTLMVIAGVAYLVMRKKEGDSK